MKKKIATWIFVLCTAMLSSSLLAQSSSGTSLVYVSIIGPDGPMEGEVVQKGREGWHRLLAYSHEIISPRDAASGLPTGKRQHKPFRFVKLVNKSSPLLLQAIAQNQVLPSVEISIWTPTSSTGIEEKVLTYKLKNASVASLRPWMPNKSDPATSNYPPAEEISLTYQSIQVTFINGNITAMDDWESPVAAPK